jgi:uncharacterized protein
MRRRTLLASGGTAIVGSAIAGGAALRSMRNSADRSLERAEDALADGRVVDVLLEGTDRETAVYEVTGADEGSTAVVLGGVHGNEVNGYRVAADATGWEIDAGRLVVIPLADVVAVERNTREGPDGDLNRLFPAGDEPESDLAGAIWSVVEEADPDVVIDLHRSRGLFDTHHRWVGQAIFPTAAGDAVEDAERVIEYMNDHHVPRTMRFHRFVMGNVQDDARDAGLLVQKVHHDLGVAGFLVESTAFLLDLGTQIRWTDAMTELLFGRRGVRRTG